MRREAGRGSGRKGGFREDGTAFSLLLVPSDSSVHHPLPPLPRTHSMIGFVKEAIQKGE